MKGIWPGPFSIMSDSLSIVIGTIYLICWQIFTIFDPYPPTIGILAKCLWRGFLILMYCDLLTIGTWGHPSPPKTCWRLKWTVPNNLFYIWNLLKLRMLPFYRNNLSGSYGTKTFFAKFWQKYHCLEFAFSFFLHFHNSRILANCLLN